MNNRSAYFRLILLVGFVLATLACNSIMNNNPVMAPVTAWPTNDMALTITCSSSAGALPESGVDFESRFEAVQGELGQANMLMQQQQYAEAILCWDDILTQVPEYADGYYQRAQGYQKLTNNQRIQSEYLDYLTHALEDLNQAILLSPEVGDYYFARYEVEYALGNNELYRVDTNFWYELAYRDINLANQFGTKGELAERDPGFMLVDLERCDEAMTEFNRLTAISPQPSAGLNTGLAMSYECLGDYEKALEHIDTAISIYPSNERDYDRAVILYNLGRLDESLKIVTSLIDSKKYYCGCRYYLRGLIYYDQGKKDLAQQDIEFGTTQTWARGGIRSYVLGHLALDNGDQQQGIALLQEAEASLSWDFDPLRKRVVQELNALGFSPLSLSVSVPPTATPLPITPQAQLPTPTTIPLDKPVNVDAISIPYSGNSPLTFRPGKVMSFHFFPPQTMNFVAAEALAFTISGDPAAQDRTIDIAIWRPAHNDWSGFSSNHLGQLSVPNAAEFVTSTGDIYVNMTIKGDQPTEIQTLGVMLTVRNADGGTSTFGFPLPETPGPSDSQYSVGPACIDWNTVTAEMAGSEVCVCGVMGDFKQNTSTNQTYFYFGRTDQLYLRIDRLESSLEGQCVCVTGQVQLDDNKTPYIVIKSNLGLCP
jgi:tetratricopeptide (TPR) repeat protein